MIGPLPDTVRYPARKGWDEFFGYGRLNAYKSVQAAAQGWIPPKPNITSPEWFQQMNPKAESFAVEGHVDARTSLHGAAWNSPRARSPTTARPPPAATSRPPNLSYCNGTTVHTGAYNGEVAKVSTAKLQALYPKTDPDGFEGNENGGGEPPGQRPPEHAALRVHDAGRGQHRGRRPKMTGEDRRQLYLHRDSQMLTGWPEELRTDGDSTPILADIEGNDRNDLIVATSDGWINAYRRTAPRRRAGRCTPTRCRCTWARRPTGLAGWAPTTTSR